MFSAGASVCLLSFSENETDRPDIEEIRQFVLDVLTDPSVPALMELIRSPEWPEDFPVNLKRAYPEEFAGNKTYEDFLRIKGQNGKERLATAKRTRPERRKGRRSYDYETFCNILTESLTETTERRYGGRAEKWGGVKEGQTAELDMKEELENLMETAELDMKEELENLMETTELDTEEEPNNLMEITKPDTEEEPRNTKETAKPRQKYLSLSRLKDMVQREGIKDHGGYLIWINGLDDRIKNRIPRYPDRLKSYQDEWVDYDTFFGPKPDRWLPLSTLMEVVQREGIEDLEGYSGWREGLDKHIKNRIPKRPDIIKSYQEEWVNYRTFFGPKKKKKSIKTAQDRGKWPLSRLTEEVRRNKITNYRDYVVWMDGLDEQIRKFIPARPDKFYLTVIDAVWIDYGTFFGTENHRTPLKEKLAEDRLIDLAVENEVNSIRSYQKMRERLSANGVKGIPFHADRAYANPKIYQIIFRRVQERAGCSVGGVPLTGL